MTAYMAVTHTVPDASRYLAEYVPLVLPLLVKHGIEVVGASLDGATLEGTANSALIFRAESEAVFHALYNDPDYAEAKAIRQSITSGGTAVVVPSVPPT